MMIKLELSVREAMNLATNCNLEIYERIVNAFELALGVNQNRRVTITSGMSTNNRIPCIKAVRAATGLGLKDAKDWTDAAVGRYNEAGYWVDGGHEISITLSSPEKAEQLLRDLTTLGCEGYLS